MKNVLCLFLLSSVLILSACQTVELPRGTSGGYQTARIVQVRQSPHQTYSREFEDQPRFHKQLQSAISRNFETNRISMVQGNSDLLVAYLIIRQGNINTSINQDYFGHGRDAISIMEEAHKRGVLDRNRSDTVDDAAIVIDILDARTDRLVFRNFAKRPVLHGLSQAQRQERINAAVAEALAPFFQ